MAGTKSHVESVTLDIVQGKLNALVVEMQHLRQLNEKSPKWWHDHAGRFENDPVFDEIVRLGRLYRNRRPAKRK